MCCFFPHSGQGVPQYLPVEGTKWGECLAQRLLESNLKSLFCIAVVWFVCDCRCWSGYSREGSGSQVHVGAEWTLPSLVNTSYGGRAEAAHVPSPSSESNKNSQIELRGNHGSPLFCTHISSCYFSNREQLHFSMKEVNKLTIHEYK